MSVFAHTSAALDWIFRRVERIDVAVLQRGLADRADRMLHPERRPHQSAQDRAGIERLMRWLRAENARGACVYFRPARGLPAPLAFVDDISPVCAREIARKYAALAVQTSSGNAQVWILLDRAADEDDRLRIQRALAEHLGGDAGSVSGEHLGRLPGFRNHKPQYATAAPWVNVIAAADGPPLTIGSILSSADAAIRSATANTRGAGRGAARGERTPRPASATDDYSRSDCSAAMAQLRRGTPEREVEAWLVASARNGERKKRNPADYARRTLLAAKRYLSM